MNFLQLLAWLREEYCMGWEGGSTSNFLSKAILEVPFGEEGAEF